jgi:hypothetical protein
MASTSETGGGQGDEPLESYIDELIHALLKESQPGAKTATPAKDPMAAALIDAVASSLSSSAPQASTLEKALLAEALASALAQALAPALAEALAPEIMKALDHLGSSDQGGTKPADQSSSGERVSKPGAKSK